MPNDIKLVLAAEDKTKAAFNSVQTGMKGLGTQVAGLRSAFAALGTVGGAAAFTNIVRKIATSAGEFKKVAAATKLSIEEVSKLSFVASQTDTSLGTLATGIARLSKSMFESVNGNKELAQLFRALGVAVTDTEGNLRKPVDVLADLADALGRVKDPAAALAVQQKLLGKGAADLAPLLAEGGAAIKTFGEQAEKLGATLDADTVNAIDQLGDNVSALSQALQGLIAKKIGPFVQDLATLSTAAVSAAEGLGKLETTKGGKVLEDLNKVLGIMGNPLKAIEAGFRALAGAIGQAGEAGKKAKGDLGPINPRGQPKEIKTEDLFKSESEGGQTGGKQTKSAGAEKDPRIVEQERILEDANEKLRDLIRERERLSESFVEATASIKAKGTPGLSAGTVLEPINAIDRARSSEDPKEAIELARQAQEQLRALADTGTVSKSLLESLSGQAGEVAEKAAAQQQETVQAQVDQAKAKLEELKDAATLEVAFDDSTVGDSIAKIAQLLQQAANENPIKFPSVVEPPAASGTESTASTPKFAGGGIVQGPGTGTSDSVLARLSAGEFVLPARAVRRYGVALIESMRAMTFDPLRGLPRFAAGGLVGELAKSTPAGGPFAGLPDLGTLEIGHASGLKGRVITTENFAAALMNVFGREALMRGRALRGR